MKQHFTFLSWQTMGLVRNPGDQEDQLIVEELHTFLLIQIFQTVG
jgi:hypothetical protein